MATRRQRTSGRTRAAGPGARACRSHLKRFPIGRVKIDGSLVRDIGIDAENTAIMRSVIALGHGLGPGHGGGRRDRGAARVPARARPRQRAGYLLGRPIAAANAWHYLDVVADELP
jgi:predicted signal transduction protein with EAL and GGDEF domain